VSSFLIVKLFHRTWWNVYCLHAYSFQCEAKFALSNQTYLFSFFNKGSLRFYNYNVTLVKYLFAEMILARECNVWCVKNSWLIWFENLLVYSLDAYAIMYLYNMKQIKCIIIYCEHFFSFHFRGLHVIFVYELSNSRESNALLATPLSL